jgi:hypothetical protein
MQSRGDHRRRDRRNRAWAGAAALLQLMAIASMPLSALAQHPDFLLGERTSASAETRHGPGGQSIGRAAQYFLKLPLRTRSPENVLSEILARVCASTALNQ